jgi:tetratricopeptide (TPR) repeat protein
MADSPSELQFEIEKLERKHAEHPEGRFFVPLANAYRKMGDVETAEALLRAGVERHPDYLSAHIVLGRCLADRGAVSEAEEEFRFVLAQDPQNLIALRTLGELAVAEGRTGEAAEWYRELLAVDPMNEYARQALDALSDAPPSPELETEFRSGAGWWQPEPEPTVEGPPLFAGSGWAEEEPAAPSEPPAAADSLEFDQWGGYGDLPGLQSDAAAESHADVGAAGSAEDEPVEEFHGQTSEVVTETIAELYARQGLHDRAASVYRELIRRRGGDAALERRLAEVERLARAEAASDLDLVTEDGGAAATGARSEEAVSGPAADIGLEPVAFETSAPPEEYAFASSFDRGFGDPEPAAGAIHEESAATAEEEEEAQPLEPLTFEAPAPAPAERSGKVTISRFLGDLVSWSPASTAALAATAAPAPAAEPAELTELTEPAADAWPEPEPQMEPEPDREEWSASVHSTIEVAPQPLPEAETDETALPYLDTGAGTEADETSLPYLEPVTERAEEFGTGSAEDEEPFPWELSGPVADLEDTSTTAAPIESYFTEEPGAEPMAAEPAPSEPAPPARSADAGGTPAASGEPAEDEALESFQAWLRSLKR